jgi:hypothetical protein
MRKTVILLGAMVGFVLLAPVQDALAQGNGNSAITYNVTNQRAFTLTGCGQVVDIDARIDIKRVQVARGGDNSGFAFHVNGKGSGVSLSGAKYNWQQNTMQRIAGSEWNGGHFESHMNTRTRAIGQGNAPDYDFSLHVHLVKNSNGQVTARYNVLDVTCR